MRRVKCRERVSGVVGGEKLRTWYVVFGDIVIVPFAVYIYLFPAVKIFEDLEKTKDISL